MSNFILGFFSGAIFLAVSVGVIIASSKPEFDKDLK